MNGVLRDLLGLKGTGEIQELSWYLRLNWPLAVLAAVVAVAIVYAVLLYRRERTVRGGRRALLGVLRAVALVLILVLLFEPVAAISTAVELPRTVLVLLDVSDSMNIRDKRRKPAQQRVAAMALGTVPYGDANAEVPDEARQAVSSASRLDLARGLLRHPTRNVFAQIAEKYRVRYFAFGEDLFPAEGKGATGPEALAALDANDGATRLGTAVEEALARFSGQSISGIIVLTDGASNEGVAPLEVARRMSQRTVPLFPVGLGLSQPVDVRLDAVLAPETVFVKDKVPVRIQFSSTGLAGQPAEIGLKLNGRDIGSRNVRLTDKAQYLELLFTPQRPVEDARLEVAIRPIGGAVDEASEVNSRTTRTIRVIDDKIKVLYVEGKPRWEYRYLRRVLLRDHRLDVTFWMTEGDKELAQYSERYVATFPMAAERAFQYDLVILGDVPRERFSRLQLARIEELVRERGGSLLLLAGMHHAPFEYLGTPVETMLPVKIRPDGIGGLDDLVHPKVTPEGLRSAVAALEYPEERNQALWYQVRPMFGVPRLDGPKKGATVLVTLSGAVRGGEPYPLICWHRHRRGKVMYVGSDQLWRLRFKRGDKHHARFWGQAIQFLTLSRLLGGNKRIQIETDRIDYRAGRRVQVNANVLDEAYSPVLDRAFDLIAERQGPERARTTVRLAAVPGMGGMFRGFFTPEQAGRYELRPADAPQEISNTVRINVEAASLERQEPAMQEDLLRRMAEEAGGRYFTPADLPEIARDLAGEQRQTSVRYTKELFDLPAIFVVLLVVLSLEWLVRRRSDLA